MVIISFGSSQMAGKERIFSFHGFLMYTGKMIWGLQLFFHFLEKTALDIVICSKSNLVLVILRKETTFLMVQNMFRQFFCHRQLKLYTKYKVIGRELNLVLLSWSPRPCASDAGDKFFHMSATWRRPIADPCHRPIADRWDHMETRLNLVVYFYNKGRGPCQYFEHILQRPLQCSLVFNSHSHAG